MNLLAHLLSPDIMRNIALTLLHFLWQGAALAAACYIGISLLRSSSARYAFSITILVLMLATPIATFSVLEAQVPATPSTNFAMTSSGAATAQSAPLAASTPGSAAFSKAAPDYFLLLVELWFAGVVLFSLRSAGGFFLVERLRRKESAPVSHAMREVCRGLQQQMGIQRIVRYCESLQLDAPVVLGWIHPVVLLPVTALSGLNEAQVRAIIAHELAHIQRLDAFVNIFQIAVESLLFYHPAVWWLGKRIREERENCCDDAAVAICGSPVTYAHALAHLAESRTAPQLIMAANRRPLTTRVARLLGIDQSGRGPRGADLSAGVLCFSAALLAGSALIGAAHIVRAQTPPQSEAPTAGTASAPVPPAARTPSATAPVKVPVTVHFGLTPALPAVARVALAAPAPVAAPAAKPMIAPNPVSVPHVAAYVAAAPQAEPSPTALTYIEGMKSAGLTDLSADQLISLKIQGITPEYVKQMHEIGLHPDADELIGMKVQGISPEYVRDMRAATGQRLDIDSLIGLKVQDVTPEYIKQMQDLGLKTDADEVIGMKVQGVTPEYVRELRGLGLKVDSDDIIGMKVQGVTPEYVKRINALGFHPSADEIIGMKVQGVDAAYLKELQSAGFKVDIDDAIGAKVQGITPEFIQKVHSHGFKDLSLEQLISLKQSGVLDAAK
jgi:beta-lactamase regulating signal transducer with metallopeptidase domain